MAENIQTTLQFQADITDFKAAMQEANRAVKLANSEFKATSSGMDDWSSSTDGLAAKLRQLSAVHEAESRKLDVLKAAYARVVEEQGATSAAAIELQTKINNQQAVVNRAAQEYNSYANRLEEVERAQNDTADSANRAGDAARNAGEDAEDSAEGWSIVKDVIADFVSNTISWAIESFKELMTAGENALATLGARTGATTEQMAKYKDVMDEVYRNNYGESFDDISEAMGVVVQTFGELDNASLQNVTQKAIALRDTFDFDYQETMRAVNGMMKQFGITADEAFNLIVQGAQNGLNQNGDLLDVINEYSMQFSSAGYSADQMFNMLANGAESGTWSVDKLGDAVKEFNIRAKDGTVSDALVEYQKQLRLTDKDVAYLNTLMEIGGERGQKAYNIILERLGAVRDDTTKYQAGVALFGTMWEDLGETTVTSLMKTEGGIDKTKAAMDDLTNTKYDTLTDAVNGLGRVVQSDLLQPIADTLAPIVKSLVEWCIENMPTLQPIIIGIASAVGVLATVLAIQGLINGVAKAFAFLNTTMLANPIVLIVAAIAGLVAAFVTLWNKSEAFRNFWINLWEQVKGVVQPIWDTIVSYFKMAWENIKVIWDVAVSYFSTLWENIKLIFSVVKDVLSGDFGAAWDKIKQIFANWGEFFGDLWEGVKNIFGSVGEFFGNAFSKAWDGIKNAWSGVKNWFGNVREGINQKFSDVDSWMGKKFGGAWTAIKKVFEPFVGYFKQAWETVKGIFSVVKNVLSGNFSGAWEAIKKIFSGWGNYFSGLWNKVTGIFSSVGSWFGNIFSKAWSGITNAFSSVGSFFSGIWDKIKSVFSIDGMLSIGKNLVQGLWNGISNSFQWIKDKISGWVGNVMSFIKRLFGIHSPSAVMRDEVGKMLGLGMAEGIEDSRNVVNGAVRKLGDAALGGLSPVGGGAPGAAAGGRAISFTQINNSPRALSRRELYRQTNNLLTFAGGVK